MLNQFIDLSCYEEFEIQATLAGISKIDILREIGQQIDNYYFFVSNDGIFNWYDLNGNHIEDPCVLKTLLSKHLHENMIKCIVPDSVTNISAYAFSDCISLTSITLPNSLTNIGAWTFYYCVSLKSITIPDSVTNISRNVFKYCDSLKEVIFRGKTLEEVKQMENYPFGIEDENTIKCES